MAAKLVQMFVPKGGAGLSAHFLCSANPI
jgi:hypothetical protein